MSLSGSSMELFRIVFLLFDFNARLAVPYGLLYSLTTERRASLPPVTLSRRSLVDLYFSLFILDLYMQVSCPYLLNVFKTRALSESTFYP